LSYKKHLQLRASRSRRRPHLGRPMEPRAKKPVHNAALLRRSRRSHLRCIASEINHNVGSATPPGSLVLSSPLSEVQNVLKSRHFFHSPTHCKHEAAKIGPVESIISRSEFRVISTAFLMEHCVESATFGDRISPALLPAAPGPDSNPPHKYRAAAQTIRSRAAR